MLTALRGRGHIRDLCRYARTTEKYGVIFWIRIQYLTFLKTVMNTQFL